MICHRCAATQQLGERQATKLWHGMPLCDECHVEIAGRPAQPRRWSEIVLPAVVALAIYLFLRWGPS